MHGFSLTPDLLMTFGLKLKLESRMQKLISVNATYIYTCTKVVVEEPVEEPSAVIVV